MDPDATLDEMLDLAQGDLNEFGDEVHKLAELTLALNKWITEGGVLPAIWRATAGAHYHGMEQS